MLTPEQLAILRADILTHTELDAYRETGNDAALADYYNALAVPSFFCWRTNIQPEEYKTAITWTEVDTLTAGKSRIWEWVTSNQTAPIDASQINIRQGLADAFQSATNTRNALLELAKQEATVLERLFALGVGSNASPATFVVEGFISPAEISGAR